MLRRFHGGDSGPRSLLTYTTKGRLHALLCYALAHLQQDIEVSEETEFRECYYIDFSKSAFRALKSYSVKIKCYRNRRERPPAWIDLDSCA